MYTYYRHVYTDGPKNDMKDGCALVSDNFSENIRIPDGSLLLLQKQKPNI